jgi:hypothetical protein
VCSAAGRKVRYAYRLRVSSTAEQLLLAEWDRCRWVWNRCVEYSKAAHREPIQTGIRVECGPALLDKHLTGWRAGHDWLGNGSSVAQQQTVRDFGRARAKALRDRKDKLPVRQRATMARKAADAAIAAAKAAVIEQADKHGRRLVLVDPKHTTTDCSKCGARAKHPLPLSQRTGASTADMSHPATKTPRTSSTTGQVSSRLALIV